MKTNALNFRLLAKTLVLALTVSLFFTSCSKDDEEVVEIQNPTASSSDIMALPYFVVNQDGVRPTKADDLLFEFRRQQPVLKPDGKQVTWGEFSNIRGNISIECTDEGTKASLYVTGLIPNGIYTLWDVTVREPGFDPDNVAEMFNISGLGATGDGFGKENIAVADARGTINIETLSPGGELSVFGEIAPCALDEREYHIVGAYHIDGKTHGLIPGPDGTMTEQFGFAFIKDAE